MKNRKLLLGFMFLALSFLTIGRANGQAWVSLGPDNVSGRTRTLIFDRFNDKVMYTGGVAGGLFVSVNDGKNWREIALTNTTMSNITSIAQDTNGALYIGTGEAFYGTTSAGDVNGKNGLLGKGVFKVSSSDANKVMPSTLTTDDAKYDWITSHFNTVSVLAGSVPEANNVSDPKAFVNKVVVNPKSNDVYVGLNGGGLNKVVDGNYVIVNGITATSSVYDIAISKTGNIATYFKEGFASSGYPTLSSNASVASVKGTEATVICTMANIQKYYDETHADSTFIGNTMGRVAFGLKNPDSLYFYVSCLYRDTADNAEEYAIVVRTDINNINWIRTTPASFSNGSYSNMALAVNDNRVTSYVYVGGTVPYLGYNANNSDIYYWSNMGASYSVSRLADGSSTYGYLSYISYGTNEIIFKENPKTAADSNFIAVATDGGIYTYSFNQTIQNYEWSKAYKNLNTTQFYSVAVAADGSVVGGTVDNGSVYIEKEGEFGNNKYGDVLWTMNSDGYTPSPYEYTFSGGSVAISQFQRTLPAIRKSLILSRPYTEIARSYSNSGDYSSIDDVTWHYGNADNAVYPGKLFPAGVTQTQRNRNYDPEITPMILWESTNSTLPDSITITIDSNTAIHRGDSILYYSRNEEVNGDTTRYWRWGSFILPGDSILVSSTIFNYPFFYVFNKTYKTDENTPISIKTVNPIQSRLIFGNYKGLYMCVNINNYNATSESASSPKTSMVNFYQLPTYQNNPTQTIHCIAISNDGKTLFATTDKNDSSFLFRFDLSTTDFMHVNDFDLPYQQVAFPRQITSLSIDPKNSNNMMITFGSYLPTTPKCIKYTENALATNLADVTFKDMQSFDDTETNEIFTNAQPIYCGVIDAFNNEKTIAYIGTDNGAYRTENIDYTTGKIIWTKIAGLDNIAVTNLYQQSKRLPAIEMYHHAGQLLEKTTFEKTQYPGAVYASTYGKGLFVFLNDTVAPNNTLISLREEIKPEAFSSLRLYPNPASYTTTLEYSLSTSSNVMLQVYDMNGRMVSSMDNGRQAEGLHSINMNVKNLKKGIYMVRVISASNVQTAKLIVR